MATFVEIQNNIYANINRTSSSALTAVIKLAINSAVELIGHNIPMIYEEEFWQHTIDSDDITNKVDNFLLPTNIDYIRTAHLVDTTTSGEEDYYPLLVVSPDDLYDTNKVEGYRTGDVGYTTSTRDISGTGIWSSNTFQRGGTSTITRANRDGRPEICARVGQNLYIFPYAASDYENWIIRLLLQMYPDSLSDDADTNTITVNFPHALMHFATGIVWASHFHDQQRATAELQLGAQYLVEVATDDKLKKLVNMYTRFTT